MVKTKTITIYRLEGADAKGPFTGKNSIHKVDDLGNMPELLCPRWRSRGYLGYNPYFGFVSIRQLKKYALRTIQYQRNRQNEIPEANRLRLSVYRIPESEDYFQDNVQIAFRRRPEYLKRVYNLVLRQREPLDTILKSL